MKASLHSIFVPSLLIICLISFTGEAQSQLIVGSKPDIEIRYLTDLPTAGILKHGEIAFDTQVAGRGGLMGQLTVGILNRLSIGISYGGIELLGTGKPHLYPLPGLFAALRVIDESKSYPALLIGFDSQGHGSFIDSLKSYEEKSLGVYIVVSRNYSFLGTMSVHGGANYSFERYDKRTAINIFGGVEKSIGEFASYVIEYNAGLNNKGGFGNGGKGFLATGIWFNLGSGLACGAAIRDIFRSSPIAQERVLLFQYVFDL